MESNFDKSASLFAHKREGVFLSFCSVSPLYSASARTIEHFTRDQELHGARLFDLHGDVLSPYRKAAAKLLRTKASNVACATSTAEGMNAIANGYPFNPGDEIISYVHEYPANHYPWVLQSKLRDVTLKLLPDALEDNCDAPEDGLARGWRFADLEDLVSDRTRVVALSHVQFTSGFAADLKKLGDFCRERNIDLIIDAAQSLGVLPIYPEEFGISAISSSAWKWLMGPVGLGVLYTSPSLREKLAPSCVGAESMKQGFSYLNHDWAIHDDARRFEYSTRPLALVPGLSVVLSDVFAAYEIEAIREEVFRLQDKLLAELDTSFYRPCAFSGVHRSGILSVVPEVPVVDLVDRLYAQGLTCTARDGYLRLAPHFCTSDQEIELAVSILNSTAREHRS
jgi:selenocysteine lyase/cysteine desulfurase